MIRKALAVMILLTPLGAQAQDHFVPDKVYFPGQIPGHNSEVIAQAIRTALARPEFVVVTKPAPDALVVTVPDKPHWTTGDNPVFDFEMAFTRDGDPVGQAAENCDPGQLDACSLQIAADIQSAARMGR